LSDLRVQQITSSDACSGHKPTPLPISLEQAPGTALSERTRLRLGACVSLTSNPAVSRSPRHPTPHFTIKPADRKTKKHHAPNVDSSFLFQLERATGSSPSLPKYYKGRPSSSHTNSSSLTSKAYFRCTRSKPFTSLRSLHFLFFYPNKFAPKNQSLRLPLPRDRRLSLAALAHRVPALAQDHDDAPPHSVSSQAISSSAASRLRQPRKQRNHRPLPNKLRQHRRPCVCAAATTMAPIPSSFKTTHRRQLRRSPRRSSSTRSPTAYPQTASKSPQLHETPSTTHTSNQLVTSIQLQIRDGSNLSTDGKLSPSWAPFATINTSTSPPQPRGVIDTTDPVGCELYRAVATVIATASSFTEPKATAVTRRRDAKSLNNSNGGQTSLHRRQRRQRRAILAKRHRSRWRAHSSSTRRQQSPKIQDPRRLQPRSPASSVPIGEKRRKMRAQGRSPHHLHLPSLQRKRVLSHP